MKRALTIATAAIAAMALMASTAAAAPNATIDVKISPKGTTTKTVPVSANLAISGAITPQPGVQVVDPMYNLTMHFTKDLSFNTNGTPVCTSDIGQTDPTNANISTTEAISRCPDSVVGDGSATLYLAGGAPGGQATLLDPLLTAFNGGTDNAGNPRIYIHGYSAQTGVGVIMIGALKNGTLSLDIPVLTANSAVASLSLNLPGDKGKDPNFAQVKCSTGTWSNAATFSLGTINGFPPAGSTGPSIFTPTDTINAQSADQSCDAANPAKFGSVKVKGPKSVKKGKKATYKVTIKNTGAIAAQAVKVTAKGKGAKGSGKTGSIPAGKSKTVKVKVKFNKKGKIKTSFKVTAKGAKAKTAKYTVKVK